MFMHDYNRELACACSRSHYAHLCQILPMKMFICVCSNTLAALQGFFDVSCQARTEGCREKFMLAWNETLIKRKYIETVMSIKTYD